MSLRDYLIEELREVREFKALALALDTEIEDIQVSIEKLIDDQFIETAKETGIARREKLLKLQPFADDTLETRRFRIKTQWINESPYTLKALKRKLDSLVGTGGYTITLNHLEYTLDVKINLGVKRSMLDARKYIELIAPANLVITVDLQYNRYKDIKALTYAALSAKTYREIREEVL